MKKSRVEKLKEEIENKVREYNCIKCGKEMQRYSFGLGKSCRCNNCGYKDGCCE
jgi:DNA-directed RNA polymerase subunit RPC12/RpoP